MFGNTKVDDKSAPLKEKVAVLEKKLVDQEHAHKLAASEVESAHKLEIKDKEFELKHFKDEEVLKLRAELEKANKDNAVLKKENEMLVKITDLNADVIDVKELVTNIVKKLPEINLTSLTVQATQK